MDKITEWVTWKIFNNEGSQWVWSGLRSLLGTTLHKWVPDTLFFSAFFLLLYWCVSVMHSFWECDMHITYTCVYLVYIYLGPFPHIIPLLLLWSMSLILFSISQTSPFPFGTVWYMALHFLQSVWCRWAFSPHNLDPHWALRAGLTPHLPRIPGKGGALGSGVFTRVPSGTHAERFQEGATCPANCHPLHSHGSGKRWVSLTIIHWGLIKREESCSDLNREKSIGLLATTGD